MASVAIGGVVLHSHSSFLGNKLKLKPLSLSIPFKKQPNSRSRNLIIYAHGGEIFSFAHDLFVGVGVGLPCTVMECGDIIYRSTLPKSNGITVTVPGVILALGTLSYLWATPGVAPGFFDMFVLAFVERLFRPTYKKDDIVLGKKLGEGSFGAVYRVSLAKKPSSKGGDFVLKKATEYGAVEIWMNERVRRACANSCADFVYGFLENSSKKGAEYWLLWRFEGEATLADLMQSREFPYNVGTFFIMLPFSC
uniref:Serine/threonine-protein kinase STN7, chloroplastic-like isoform X2 n=1 Tax=Nicotiana sylvestris TaxID=4096 RepID=A0A1U7YNV1_NICSY|nr:PREDICTED: serine/threonine-protein kinase STN7, chloroplastic-like isoform X2 [Nicotiana sylvestris]